MANPATAWRIERLSAAHDRTAFCCGEPTLDEFLRRLATQYAKRDMGRTYVAVSSDQPTVLGYYTLSTGSVDFVSLPEDVRRKLPHHPIPIVLLGRLAVDQSARGKGLGETLLLDALGRCSRLADEVAIHAVVVDALDEAARRFYIKYGFAPLLDDLLHLYLTMKVIRQLRL